MKRTENSTTYFDSCFSRCLEFAEVVRIDPPETLGAMIPGKQKFTVKISTNFARKCTKFYKVSVENEAQAKDIIAKYLDLRREEPVIENLPQEVKLLLEHESEEDFNLLNWNVVDNAIDWDHPEGVEIEWATADTNEVTQKCLILAQEQLALLLDFLTAINSNITENTRNRFPKFDLADTCFGKLGAQKKISYKELKGLLDTIAGYCSASELAVKKKITSKVIRQDIEALQILSDELSQKWSEAK